MAQETSVRATGARTEKTIKKHRYEAAAAVYAQPHVEVHSTHSQRCFPFQPLCSNPM
jgi:hypothetical protein